MRNIRLLGFKPKGRFFYPQIQFLNELSVSDNGKSYIRFYDLDDNLIEVASWKQCIKRG